jgi:hypothetical protein
MHSFLLTFSRILKNLISRRPQFQEKGKKCIIQLAKALYFGSQIVETQQCNFVIMSKGNCFPQIEQYSFYQVKENCFILLVSQIFYKDVYLESKYE